MSAETIRVNLPPLARLWLGWDEPLEDDGSRWVDRYTRITDNVFLMDLEQIREAWWEVTEAMNHLSDGLDESTKEKKADAAQQRRDWNPSLTRLRDNLSLAEQVLTGQEGNKTEES